MFFERFKELCTKNKTSPTAVTIKLGYDRSNVTYWSKGNIPKTEIISNIANYFNTSIAYLLCETDDPTTTDDKKEPAPELYPGQADDLLKLQKLAEKLSTDDIKALIKYVDYLNSQP